MCGGGRIPAPNPEAEWRARSAFEAEQRRFAQQDQQHAEERRMQNFDRAMQRRNRELDSALGRSLDRFAPDLQRYHGLQADDELAQRFSPFIREQLENTFAMPDPNNPQGTFQTPARTETAFTDALNQFVNREQGAWRQQQGRSLDTLFKPNFEQSLFADSLDDPIIEDILGQQYLDADTRLRAAFDRGQLNQTGADFARRHLDDQRTQARTRLGQIGSDVLTGKRRELTGLRDRAFQERDSLRLGQGLTDYSSMLDNLVQDRRNNLSGAIRGAVGNESLFNVNDLINRAGGFQGATNVNFAQTGANRRLFPNVREESKQDEDREEAAQGGTF